MVLVFDVKGDMALFRKPYTTTSMVSYPFPPPTAVAGLIAAIIGINHGASDEAKSALFWDYMRGVQVGIGIITPVKWMSAAVNLIFYKTPNAELTKHTQVKHQLVKNPHYRIYVKGGDIYPELKEKLTKEEFIYTPYLGAAYALADIDYIGEYQAEKVKLEEGFDTLVPANQGVKVDIVRSKAVFSETVPTLMSSQRRLIDTKLIYYTQPKENEVVPLYLRELGDLEASLVNGEKVAWFDAW